MNAGQKVNPTDAKAGVWRLAHNYPVDRGDLGGSASPQIKCNVTPHMHNISKKILRVVILQNELLDREVPLAAKHVLKGQPFDKRLTDLLEK